MRGEEIVKSLRHELSKVNEEILNHPVIKLAAEGKLPRKSIVKLVVNQLYIVPHDMRSLARMLSRSVYSDEVEFFKTCLDGDYAAFKELIKLASELGIDPQNLDTDLIDARAVAYTHYLAWLSNYASLGEAAVALVVNLPVWGENVDRLAKALKEKYGIKEVGFFELFSHPYTELERMAYPIIERYEDIVRYRLVAKMIQAYEKMFWDAVGEV